MTDAERKAVEEEIRALRAEIQYFEKGHPGDPRIEQMKNTLIGKEKYLRGF